MAGLQDYLADKRDALLRRRHQAASSGPAAPHTLSARVRAEGRSGVRRIRIRDFQLLSDSGPDFAGYNLGPSSPELQLGVLGSCLTHIFLIQAAERQVPLDALEVEVSAQQDPRAGRPGFEQVPVYPHTIQYTVHVTSSASDAELAELHAAVERVCPILNLLVNPQHIGGSIVHTLPQSAAVAVA